MVLREIDYRQVRLLRRVHQLRKAVITDDGLLIDAASIKCDAFRTLQPCHSVDARCFGCIHCVDGRCMMAKKKQLAPAWYIADESCKNYFTTSIFYILEDLPREEYIEAKHALRSLKRLRFVC